MKKKEINAAICDAREVTEESLAGFDTVTINAAILVTNERARSLFRKYPVSMNVASVVDVPEDEDVRLQVVNAAHEIGPGANGAGVILVVNGTLLLVSGSLDAAKSYSRIIVNGTVRMPKSYQGQLANITENGKTEYYPDGASFLKQNSAVDDLFVLRAANSLYYCPGKLFFLDATIDMEKILEKNIHFAAKQFVIAESLLTSLLPQLNEEAAIVRVPDGAVLIADDLNLDPQAIQKYGAKLYVHGDVTISDAEALAKLEYLYADGTVYVDKTLADALDAIENHCAEKRIVDVEEGLISDRPMVKIGTPLLQKYPRGIRVTDCARVTLSGDLSPEDILNKIHISDCAIVRCSAEQEDAVHAIAEDVALIQVGKPDAANAGDNPLDGIFGDKKDTQVINAVEYRL